MTTRFTMSQDSVTVFLDGAPKTFYKGSTQYTAISQVLPGADQDTVRALIEPHGLLTKQCYGTDFLVDASGKVTYKGNPVPDAIVTRMNELANKGETVAPILRFFERLD